MTLPTYAILYTALILVIICPIHRYKTYILYLISMVETQHYIEVRVQNSWQLIFCPNTSK